MSCPQTPSTRPHVCSMAWRVHSTLADPQTPRPRYRKNKRYRERYRRRDRAPARRRRAPRTHAAAASHALRRRVPHRVLRHLVEGLAADAGLLPEVLRTKRVDVVGVLPDQGLRVVLEDAVQLGRDDDLLGREDAVDLHGARVGCVRRLPPGLGRCAVYTGAGSRCARRGCGLVGPSAGAIAAQGGPGRACGTLRGPRRGIPALRGKPDN
eukprot:gene1981-biopygen16900